MAVFNWLHLTDLHRGMREQNWLWPNVRDIFFADLERLCNTNKCGPWDLVLFTGDLTQRGTKEEFLRVDEILERLWDQFERLGSKPKLVAIPGNHDLVRPDPNDPAVILLKEWNNRREVQDQFWDDGGSKYREVINSAFENYIEWWQRQRFKPPNVVLGMLPGDISVSLEKEGAEFGIVGLNSTFLQLTGDDYEGKLALHANQFQSVCNGDGPDWAKKHHACLLMTHHPPAWLNGVSRGYLNAEVNDHGRFAVHLCGHLHENLYRDISTGGTEPRRIWQGRSLFGLESFSVGSERRHGYTAGQIQLSGETGKLIFWPRRDEMQGDQREIVPDYSSKLNDDQHTNPATFSLLRKLDLPPLPPPPRSGPPATVSFIVSRTEGIQIATACPSPDGELKLVLEPLPPDPPALWDVARGSRGAMEIAMQSALREAGHYPFEAADAMLRALGWYKGLESLVASGIRSLNLNLASKASSFLLPELVPLLDSDRWLDTQFPIYRTLDHIDQPPVEKHTDKTLAILYQEEEPFSGLATGLFRDLRENLPLTDIYSGSQFEGDPSKRFLLLQDVFHRHRAVLFIGHLHRSSGGPGGWQLTPNVFLSMQELNRILGGSIMQNVPRPSQSFRRNAHVPEVIFANCCSGAWMDPSLSDNSDALYPAQCLSAGVRFFIGTWMDIVLNETTPGSDIEIIRTLIYQFFTQWAADPDRAVEHLYLAKRACDFHLLTTLYQIYTRPQPASYKVQTREERLTRIESRELWSALVSGLSTKDRLGDYVLEGELWADPYARTFWALSTNEKPHLVQVLADEWQDLPNLTAELDAAVQRLAQAGLNRGHLIPDRHERVMWYRSQPNASLQELRHLHILVYDRPSHESSDDWSTLAALPFDRNSPGYLDEVLKLGAAISLNLSELHQKQIVHGNLDQRSIVFIKEGNGYHPVIKDPWVKQIRPGRITNTRYAAPEETTQLEHSDRFKYDCWGLGVILFELATGQSPVNDKKDKPPSIRDVLAVRVPEALDRVVYECLMPAAAIRPNADLVARRLLLALHAGGTYINEFEQTLEQYIYAGHRLFTVFTDDVPELRMVLVNMASRTHIEGAYHLYEANEEIGLRDARSGALIFPWTSAEAIHMAMAQEAAQYNLPTPTAPTSDEIGSLHGAMILGEMSSIAAGTPERVILLVYGSTWWSGGSVSDQLTIERLLKMCRKNASNSPVILIADNYLELGTEIERLFVSLPFPPASPSELFEYILAAPKQLQLPDISDDVAIDLASQLYPISKREATEILRLGGLQYEKIDERVVGIRDEARAMEFQRFGAIDYIPLNKLPRPEFIGLPDEVEARAIHWAAVTLGQLSAPRKLLISGPSGYGKSIFAQTLAARIRCPVLRIEVGSCIRSGLGESESSLREALWAANSLERAVVLLDDIDRFLDPQQAMVATLSRMSSIFLQWLDTLPLGIIAIMTINQQDSLPLQWRRRIELALPLDEPPLAGKIDASLTYRCSIFSALFRKFGLGDLAEDKSLMQDLATWTHPDLRSTPLPSPAARKSDTTSIHNQVIYLNTGADIENWIVETIDLHCISTELDRAMTTDFWREASQ